MSALLPFLTLEQTCEKVDQWVREKLTHAGLRVTTTFDLQIARAAHADCQCPNHGTEACNCQMVILLVYGKQEDPATLVIHGQDGKTWLSVAADMQGRSRHYMESSFRNILVPPSEPGSASTANDPDQLHSEKYRSGSHQA